MTRALDGDKNLGDRWADRAFRDQFRMNLSGVARAKPSGVVDHYPLARNRRSRG